MVGSSPQVKPQGPSQVGAPPLWSILDCVTPDSLLVADQCDWFNSTDRRAHPPPFNMAENKRSPSRQGNDGAGQRARPGLASDRKPKNLPISRPKPMQSPQVANKHKRKHQVQKVGKWVERNAWRRDRVDAALADAEAKAEGAAIAAADAVDPELVNLARSGLVAFAENVADQKHIGLTDENFVDHGFTWHGLKGDEAAPGIVRVGTKMDHLRGIIDVGKRVAWWRLLESIRLTNNLYLVGDRVDELAHFFVNAVTHCAVHINTKFMRCTYRGLSIWSTCNCAPDDCEHLRHGGDWTIVIFDRAAALDREALWDLHNDGHQVFAIEQPPELVSRVGCSEHSDCDVRADAFRHQEHVRSSAVDSPGYWKCLAGSLFMSAVGTLHYGDFDYQVYECLADAESRFSDEPSYVVSSGLRQRLRNAALRMPRNNDTRNRLFAIAAEYNHRNNEVNAGRAIAAEIERIMREGVDEISAMRAVQSRNLGQHLFIWFLGMRLQTLAYPFLGLALLLFWQRRKAVVDFFDGLSKIHGAAPRISSGIKEIIKAFSAAHTPWVSLGLLATGLGARIFGARSTLRDWLPSFITRRFNSHTATYRRHPQGPSIAIDWDDDHTSYCPGLQLGLPMGNLKYRGKPYSQWTKDEVPPCEPQRGCRRLGPTVFGLPSPIVPTPCVHNLVYAFYRIAKRVAKPTNFAAVVADFEKTEHFAELQSLGSSVPTKPLQQYLSESSLPAHRIAAILAADKEPDLEPVVFSAMVKLEKTNPKCVGRTECITPDDYRTKPFRPILVMPFKFQARTGPTAERFSRMLKLVFHERATVCYAAGLDPLRLGEWRRWAEQQDFAAIVMGDDWLARVNGAWIKGDNSRHDGHVDKDVKRYVIGLVDGACKDAVAAEACKLERSTLDLVVKAMGLTLEVEGRQATGDSFTSAFNSTESIIVLLVSYVRWQNTDRSSDSFRAIVTEAWTQFGFECVADEVDEPTFCSGVFVPVGKTFLFATLPGRALAKAFWQFEQTALTDGQWSRAVAMSGTAVYHFVPVLRTFFARQFALHQHEKEKKLSGYEWYDKSGRYTTHVSPDDNTYEWFMERYDCSRADIKSAEGEAAEAGPRARLHHPLFNKIVQTDHPWVMPDDHVEALWMPPMSLTAATDSVIVSPIIEEAIKHQIPGAWLLYALAEGFDDVRHYGRSPVAFMRPCFHLLTTYQSLPLAVIYHFAWNLSACFKIPYVQAFLIWGMSFQAPYWLSALSLGVFGMCLRYLARGPQIIGQSQLPFGLDKTTFASRFLHHLAAYSAYQRLVKYFQMNPLPLASPLPEMSGRGRRRVSKKTVPVIVQRPSAVVENRNVPSTAVAVLPKKQRKPRKKKRHPRQTVASRHQASQRGGLVLEAELISERNAALFLNALCHPYDSAPTYLPDGTFPAGRMKRTFKTAFGFFGDSVTNTIANAGLFVIPYSKGCFTTVTAIASGALTWASATDHPDESAYETDFALMRCTAMSIRIINFGKLQSMGAEFFYAYWPNLTPPTTVATFTNYTWTEEVSTTGAKMMNTPEFAWKPLSFQAQIDPNGSDDSSALGWHYPALANRYDSALALMARMPATAGTPNNSDAFEAEITHHFNSIAFPGEEMLFNQTMPVGSQASVDKVLATAAVAGAASGTTKEETWLNAVGSAVNDIISPVKSVAEPVLGVAKAASGIMEQVASPVMDIFGGFGLLAIPSDECRRVLRPMHSLACALGQHEWSPRRNNAMLAALEREVSDEKFDMSYTLMTWLAFLNAPRKTARQLRSIFRTLPLVNGELASRHVRHGVFELITVCPEIAETR